MERIFLVAAGGAIGSVARYLVGMATLRTLGPGWPHGTFTVNVVGGFLIGALAGYLAFRGGEHQDRIRLLLQIGVLGGFTTFSAFSLDVALMIERRSYMQAAAYSLASMVLSVAALFVGLTLARRLFA